MKTGGRKIFSFRIFCSVAALAAGLFMLSCAGPTTQGLMATRHETAMNLATPSRMVKRRIQAAPFVLTVYERADNPGGEANIYIEGDGLAWMGRRTPSLDPTPTNPVALRLAARDDAENVIYMARPCQYSKMIPGYGPCSMTYWTSKRFAPEIINAMDAALNEIKARYNLTGFHLIGYSGGATIAAFLAAERTDVRSLRTVGGNLDHDTINRYHKVSLLSGSLNAVEVAPKLANMPQHHFIGAKDKVIPLSALQSYSTAMGPTSCLRSTIIGGASHEKGWDSRWPMLLAAPLDCSSER